MAICRRKIHRGLLEHIKEHESMIFLSANRAAERRQKISYHCLSFQNLDELHPSWIEWPAASQDTPRFVWPQKTTKPDIFIWECAAAGCAYLDITNFILTSSPLKRYPQKAKIWWWAIFKIFASAFQTTPMHDFFYRRNAEPPVWDTYVKYPFQWYHFLLKSCHSRLYDEFQKLIMRTLLSTVTFRVSCCKH